MYAFRSPLAWRLVTAVFLAILFIEAVILVPSYLREEERLIDAAVKEVVQVARIEFTQPVDYSIRELSNSIEELLHSERIKGVAITLPGGDKGGVAGESINSDTQNFPFDSISVVRVVPERIEVVIPYGVSGLQATAVIRADVSNVGAHLTGYVWRITGLACIIALFVTVVTMLVLWHLILRPILILNERIQSAGSDWDVLKLLPEELTPKGEVGDLFRTFDRMLSTIRTSTRLQSDLAKLSADNPNPVIRCGKSGEVEYANDAAKRVEGLFEIGFQARVAGPLAAHVAEVSNSGRASNAEVPVSGRRYAVTFVPVADELVNIFARDVTPIRQAEEESARKSRELEELNRELQRALTGLEVQVAERTADLVHANAKLATQMRKIEEEESRLRAFAESAADYYWEMDGNLRFSYFSERFTDITGVPQEMLLGRTRAEVGAPGVDPAVWEKHLRTLQEHRPFRNFVHSRPGPDDSVIYLSINGLPLFADDGTFVGYRGTGSDVTRQREAEDELRKAKEVAELAVKARSQFLATMSHEIRTPMNGVLGMTDLLMDTELDESQQMFAKTIRDSAMALLTILNDILDLAKIESGNIDLENASFSLTDVAEGVVDILAPQAFAKKIEIAAICDPELPGHVRGDGGRLRQVLMNLVGNAVKFTATGHVLLELKLIDMADGKATVRFNIQDTGIGIPADGMDKLFRDFSQVDSSITRRYGGTGLGLSICSRLVDMMGGRIDVESVEGEGSTFGFTLTLPAEGGRSAESAGVLNARVLVVDDNAVNRRVFEGYLRSFGIPFALAEGHEQALAALAEAASSGDPFDIVVLDHQIPDVDGVELARTIRNDPAIASTRLVLLSSAMDAVNQEDIESLAIAATVYKPVRRHIFFETMSRAVEGKRWREAPAQVREKFESEGGLRILLVEDNPTNQKLGARMLEKMGHEVVIANDGQEGVTKAGDRRYDLILMDLHMPKMDGLQATRAIRAGEGPCHAVPIIALTADAMPDTASRCRSAGMDDYLTKPLTSDILANAISMWCSRGQPEGRVGGGDTAAAAEPVKDGTLLDKTVVGDMLQQLDTEDVADLLNDYADQLSGLYADIQGVVADVAELQARAHSLAGGAAAIGLRELSQMSKDVERHCINGDADAAGRGVEAMRPAVGRAGDALREFIGGLR